MRIQPINVTLPYRQRGVASLIISLILLVTITFSVIYTSRSVLMEQKVSTNEFRGRMAFEAAEKGNEAAMTAILDKRTIEVVTTTDAVTGNPIVRGKVTLANVIFDTDGDGTFDSNSGELLNGSSVTVTLTSPSIDASGYVINMDDPIRYDIVSVGLSDDRAASRTVTQVLVVVPPVPNTPDSPLLSRSAIVIGGSATIINPEGHSTIWSGDDVNVGSNSSTSTEIADPTHENYPDCLGGSVQCDTTPSSSPDVLGLDIIGNDTNLSNLTDDEFFYNFLGDDPQNYRESRVDIETTDLPSLDGQVDGLIVWQEGDIAIAAGNTFGSLNDPALVIINGNLNVTGNNFFNGLLFVTGSISGGGNLTVTGAAVVNGVGTTGGGVTVTYNSQVLDLLNLKGGRPTGSAGSWHDF